MRWLSLLAFVFFCSYPVFSQETSRLSVRVVNERQLVLANASVELLKPDSTLLKILLSDSAGEVHFYNLVLPSYLLRVSLLNHAPVFEFVTPGKDQRLVTLLPIDKAMENIVVRGRRPFLEIKPDRTVVNVDAAVTNAGATVLETLEKLPGVTVDRDGKISLRGRAGTAVFVDGKPSYLSDADLSTMLNGMAASQVAQIELLYTPPAGYDAAGNAGIINLKLRKSSFGGFNGSLTLSGGQGYYTKGNGSLLLNYNVGKVNAFANYSAIRSRTFLRAEALRSYLNGSGAVTSLLDQYTFRSGLVRSHNLRSGVDVSLNKNSTIGFVSTLNYFDPESSGTGDAQWMKAGGEKDSLIRTTSRNATTRRDVGFNLNYRTKLSANSDFSADLDLLRFRIRGYQFVANASFSATPSSEAFQADVPTNISIYSAKADYSHESKEWKTGFGWKSTQSKTDNKSDFEIRTPNGWTSDLAKSNHFRYNETIHAAYGQLQTSRNRWLLQGGLRFECTKYDAHQLGNAIVKDSSFSRQYNSFFPTLSASFEKDSINTFALSVGRRIDRPVFQKMNPFLLIINKYTYQRGNPFYRPQFTWNVDLSHTYKNAFVTTLSYSVTNDFFSQIFPVQSGGIVLYTEGNLKRMQNLGATVALQLSPIEWWSFSLQTGVNHRKLEGTIVYPMTASNTQFNLNLTNQVRISKTWSGELSGFYVSASQEDIQEVLDPYGQLSIGLAKSFAESKGSLKLTVRDVFYTNWTKGFTQFFGANENFNLTRDTRVATLAFVWRFGKAVKTARRSEGGAGDEIKRVLND